LCALNREVETLLLMQHGVTQPGLGNKKGVSVTPMMSTISEGTRTSTSQIDDHTRSL